MEQQRHQTGEAVNGPYCWCLVKEFYYEHIKKYNGRLQAILACTLV
jgi:hypothetical protein